MKKALGAAAVSLALCGQASAQDGEGRRLAGLAFQSLDTAARGFVDQGEFTNFGNDVFYSVDEDQNDQLSLREFLNWDFGMRLVAQNADRENAYETALRVVFAFWDRDGDNQISRTEHRQSLTLDFSRADTDGNAVLSEQEFTRGYSVMVALRAAINPPPVE